MAAVDSAETDRNYLDEIRDHSSVRLWQYRHLDHCTGFHEQRKHLRKVPLQQRVWKTLLYAIGVGASKILGARRIFARISPNVSEKLLCNFCLQIFFHKDHEDLFLVWPRKKGLHLFFYKLFDNIFGSQTTLGASYPSISFSVIQFLYIRHISWP